MGWQDELDDALKVANTQAGAYNPAQSSTGYLINESKLVPAGLLGMTAETGANALKLGQAGLGWLSSSERKMTNLEK